MAWLTGWNRRKSKIVNGTTAGLQTDYQIKLTVRRTSGTDTATDIYLGTNVNNDFSDLRFTSSDGTTLLNYWIESLLIGSNAIVWIKIPSIPTSPGSTTIYIYYDNITAPSISNGTNTFIQWHGYANAQFYDSNLSIPPVIYEAYGRRISGDNFYLGLSSTGIFYQGNSVNIHDYTAFNARYLGNSKNGTISETSNGPAFAANTWYKFKIVVSPTSIIFDTSGYSTVTTTTNVPIGTMGLTMQLTQDGISSHPTNGEQQYSFTRKYASPEPTFGSSGIEETPGCPTSPKYEGDTVHLSATPKDGTGPYYVEFRKSIEGISTIISFYTNAPENVEIIEDYILTNEDIRTAYSGIIRFSVYMEDSCPPPLGPQTCTQYCDVIIGCYAPVCNFTVT